MIRFLNDETVAGHRHGKGTIALFDSATEAALITAGDAEDYPAVVQPVEVLSSSAVAVSCASTAADEVLASFTIRAGIFGVNSILQIEPLWTHTNSANNKLLKVKVGGSTIYTATRTTTAKEAPLIVLANRNSLSAQIQPYDNTYVTAGSGAPATYAIDFSAAVDVEITGQRANGVDTLALQYFRALHFVGA
ncbi:hypothetical protein SAMN05216428_102366 [Nitrosospira sp. Nsp11]|uniref:hypothetical protein n=1 Tax=Nitrosospira sp. Nsp11 TaxID=1855338 RepID=UPI00091DD678|nr:hypothetical protein [Nitrosospira sp. Nsp11]SHL42564.1 hypothetical protein SAMN05216428_102366 [Nitrosospira sp. Nsp11]